MPSFVHLHVHTQYSILDGAAFIPKLFDKAEADNQPAMAITDHGNMFGVKEFLNTAKKYPSVKPILGCEVYLAPEGRLLKKNKEEATTCHLVLLAKNHDGYLNLIKLVSQAWIDGVYYKPRIDHELLQQYHHGLIAMSACLAGELPRLVLAGKIEEASHLVAWYKDLFGEDYYIELQRHKTRLTTQNAMECFTLQKQIEPHLIALAQKHQVKLVATNDVHFVNYEDAPAHDRLICVATNDDVTNENRKIRYTEEEYLKSCQEMTELFTDIPEALATTLEIAGKVERFSLDRDPILPHFPIPAEFPDADAYLRHLTYKGAERLYGRITPELAERIDMELGTISGMKFPDYFLIVADFIRAAREMDVWVGPGRGSAAGSVVAYCMGITLVDPIRYGLLFERFLNKERISFPDIDIDFADDGRSKVLQYVENKYGKDHVSHVVTFGTMAARSAIKDVARVQRLPLQEAERLAKLIPDRLPDKDGKPQHITIENSLKYVPELLAALKSEDPLVSSTVEYALRLEGSIRNTGVHASAIIIGPDTLTNFIPLSTTKDKETGEDILVSQFEGSLIEQVGMLKMDFLGLKTLSILKNAVETIKANHNTTLDINNLPLTDPATYELFSRGDTVGVFQFESDGMRKWLRELKPSCIEDLIAMTALYRPGPMDYIPDFIDRKHGRKTIVYDLPQMEKVLKETYGVTVYQEQVMLLSREIAGFSGLEADSLRRAMGKKKPEEMEKMKQDYLTGGKNNGFDETVLKKIWVDWTAFAQYAFNKSHAASYSILSYQTGYLKTKYPSEFMAAVLSGNRNNIEEVSKYMDECKRMEINVLGPDINESAHDFTVNRKGDIRFGMSGIKGVGYGAVESIILAREQGGPFRDIYDFAERVNLNTCNRKVLESLVYAGAFDSFTDIKRHQYFLPCNKDGVFLDSIMRYGSRVQEEKNKDISSLFGSGPDSLAPPERPVPPHMAPETTEDFLKKEKEMVGIYLSSHPLDKFNFEIKHFTSHNLQQVQELLDNNRDEEPFVPREVRLGGLVTNVTSALARNSGRPWGTFTLEDYTASWKFTLFGKEYEKFLPYMREGEALLVKCLHQERVQYKRKGQEETTTSPKEKELRIQEISLLSNARESLQSITMDLGVEQISGTFRTELVRVLSENPGKITVHFVLKDKANKMAVKVFSRSHRIDLTPDFLNWIQKKGIAFSVE
ncbi:MAG: DNA polymerase III subunit alpha [Bacteroidales bacterium]|nr:DNA polymerase III subunit alpha [Bacteroidales bacterium]MDD4030054.1 DNA polymerase III subunit alpha [Bacteroidales bacterium]MDD4436073.1 DNA polymerase III subunit alpha [Bacteroidales bacterium]MDD5732595.1 DNA polymerase III subunit alpha [Bacteroidales bacterium]